MQPLNYKKISIIALVLIAGIGVSCSAYFYKKYQTLKANPSEAVNKETAALVATVGALIDLPSDETPTVATVLDKEKLKGQDFFKTAENGDKLLAYNTAMRAILYRPSTHRIINVSPITISQPQATPLALRVAYFNGTTTVGLSGNTEKKIQSVYPNWQTTILANAAKNNYEGTLVVDLSGQHAKEAADCAALLHGTVGPLPVGEATPDADILILSGN